MAKNILVTLLSAFIFSAGAAYALPVSWAVDVHWYPGAVVDEDGNRGYEANALGAPSEPSVSDNDVNFLSLGLGGYAVFDFGTEFHNNVVIFETTYNRSGYFEGVDVFAIEGDSFDFAETDPGPSFEGWTNYETHKNTYSRLDISIGGPFRYLALRDVTKDIGGVGDGFDVNAVGVNPVPEPSTMLLFGTGLTAAAGFRIRKKK